MELGALVQLVPVSTGLLWKNAPLYLSIRCILGDIRLWVGDPSSRRVERLFDIFLPCVPPPRNTSLPIQEQLLGINGRWFRGGRVSKARRLLHHSDLGLRGLGPRVMKEKDPVLYRE